MNHHLRNALEVIAFVVVVSLIWMAIPTHAHSGDQAPVVSALESLCR